MAAKIYVMATGKSNGCFFFFIILTLLGGAAFVLWGRLGGRFGNSKQFSLEEYCQFLPMTENQRAEIMYEKDIEEHNYGETIRYDVSKDVFVDFYTPAHIVNDWYTIKLAKKKLYEDFIADVKKAGEQIPDPANNNRVAYQIFKKYIIYDLGFQRETKQYHIVVDDTKPLQ